MDASMMRAITYSEFGMSTDVLKLRELPVPKADKGEVLVSLEYSGSNPSDAKSRAGNRPGITKPQFEQIVPNSDGSGIITAVGEGVDKLELGKECGYGMANGNDQMELRQSILQFRAIRLSKCQMICLLKRVLVWEFLD